MLVQQQKEAVRQPVGVRVVGRVVECDLLRVELRQHLAQRFAERGVVSEHRVVRAKTPHVFGVKAAENSDAPARPREQKRALPGDIVAVDKRQHRVEHRRRFAHEGQPAVNLLFLEDAGSLIEFFTD